MARKVLTERKIDSLKPAPKGKRLMIPDGIVPGMWVRVTDTGSKSFVLVARYPLRPKHPAPRALAEVGEVTLAEARDRAREWLKLIQRGIDPKVEEARQRALEGQRQANTWQAVVAAYLEQRAANLAKSAEAKAILEGEFGKRRGWALRPMGDITSLEAANAIRAIVDRGAPAQARNARGYGSALYAWAIGSHLYGLETNPFAAIKANELIGPKVMRKRILSDAELREVWAAAGKLGEPYGPLVRLLIVTGQRRDEIGEASSPEIQPAGWRDDLKAEAALVIPPERMKMESAHVVPLVPLAVDLLRPLKIGESGHFIFTTTDGAKAVNGYSKAKERLDKLIAKARAEARAGEGTEPEEGDYMPHWVFHDLRRTMRTHLSALPIEDVVREAIIAHAKPGLHKVYDQWAYLAEKRRALELWAARLLRIVEPAPASVTPIEAARAKRGKERQ